MALLVYGRALLFAALSLGLVPVAAARADGDRDKDDDSCRWSRSADCDDEHKDDDDGDDDDGWCEDLHGAAFGLCNAFCNAQACHLDWKSSCDELRRNFEKHTGDSQFPCESGEPTSTPDEDATFTPTRTPGEATATVTPQGPTPTSTFGVTLPTATATFAGTVATLTPTPLEGADACSGLSGAAFGLCNAFCNAQECQLNPHHPSCDELRRNFERQTGSDVFPCETGATRTPDGEPGECECDCDGDGHVTINDLMRSVRMVLGVAPTGDCHALGGRPNFTIGDLVRGVRDALDGC